MVNNGGNVARKRIIVNDGARINRSKNAIQAGALGGKALISNREAEENLSQNTIEGSAGPAARQRMVIDNDGGGINQSENHIAAKSEGGRAVILNRDNQKNGSRNHILIAADNTASIRALIDNRRADVNESVNSIAD